MNSDLHSLHSVTFFRKQTEKDTTEYTCLFHAIQCHFAHSKTLLRWIKRGYFTANELWLWCYKEIIICAYTTDVISVGNQLSLQKLKENIWRDAESVSKRYVNSVSWKIFGCCKACLDIGDQCLKLLHKIQEVKPQGKNRSKISCRSKLYIQ